MVARKREKRIVSIIGIFLLVIFATLIFQMARIQLFDHDIYANKAKAQHFSEIEIPARRGPILDRNGKKLADSIRVSSISANPCEIKDKLVVANKLSDLLDLDEAKIRKLLKKDKKFVWIKRKVTDIEEIEVKRLKIKGIYTSYEYERLYPNNELVSHITGITDIDGNGIEGIEYKFDHILKGTKGYFKVRKDGRQQHITSIDSGDIPPKDGFGIMLTIDSVIQKVVEDEIETAFRDRKAESVTAIVMDTATGEILAMANRPTFNPNNFTRYPPDFRRNRAVTDSYEPGSILKPLIIAALLDNDIVTPNHEIFCHNGMMRIGSRRLHDAHPYGDLTVSDIIVKSSNIGMAKLSDRIGSKRLYNHLEMMNFGKKLGVKLPGEASGVLHNLSSWTSYSMHSIAMGQEISVTPLQFVAAFCSIANGGNLLRPTIVSAVTKNDGRTIVKKLKTPKIIKRVMSPKVARDLLNQILIRVVNDGTGTNAKMEKYQIAGKTGTAQKIENNVYSHSKFIGSFVGYAPAEEPSVCVLVMVNEPKGKYYGGTVAAPVVKNIIEKTLDYKNGKSIYIQQEVRSFL